MVGVLLGEEVQMLSSKKQVVLYENHGTKAVMVRRSQCGIHSTNFLEADGVLSSPASSLELTLQRHITLDIRSPKPFGPKYRKNSDTQFLVLGKTLLYTFPVKVPTCSLSGMGTWMMGHKTAEYPITIYEGSKLNRKVEGTGAH